MCPLVKNFGLTLSNMVFTKKANITLPGARREAQLCGHGGESVWDGHDDRLHLYNYSICKDFFENMMSNSK